MELKKIIFRKGKATYLRKPVVLPEGLWALLKSKGEKGSISIKAKDLKYENNTENSE